MNDIYIQHSIPVKSYDLDEDDIFILEILDSSYDVVSGNLG